MPKQRPLQAKAETENTLNTGQESGRTQVSHKLVLSIALPMTIGFLTTPLLGLVDTAVIGQMGVAALIGGLAVGTILVDMVFFTFNFLRSGTVGLTAQAFGADNKTEIQAILIRALGLAFVLGIVLIITAPIFLSIGLTFMDPGETAANAAQAYYQIRVVSAPFALANYALFGWLIGFAKNKTALALQLFINGLNIVLSIYLTLELGWGISGVAIATVIAETAGCLAGLVIAWQLHNKQYRPEWAYIRKPSAIKRMMSMNGDIMIRSFSLLFAFSYFTAQSAKYGDVVLAANAILLHFFFVGGYFLDGLAGAAEQLAGRAIGARDRAFFVAALRLTIFWSSIMAMVMAGLYMLFGQSIIDLLTTSIPVRDAAKDYFYWASFICLAGVLAFIMDGIYMGSTWSREMSITMVISLIGFIAFWQIAQNYLGNNGLWMSFYCFLILRGVTMAVLLPRNIRQTFK